MCAPSTKISAILQDRANAIEPVAGDGADGEEGGDLSGFLVPVVDLPDNAEQAAIGLGDKLPARLDLPGQPFHLARCQGEPHRGSPDHGRGGRDEGGAFERWVGENFPTHEQAEAAALDWERRAPSTREEAP